MAPNRHRLLAAPHAQRGRRPKALQLRRAVRQLLPVAPPRLASPSPQPARVRYAVLRRPLALAKRLKRNSGPRNGGRELLLEGENGLWDELSSDGTTEKEDRLVTAKRTRLLAARSSRRKKMMEIYEANFSRARGGGVTAGGAVSLRSSINSHEAHIAITPFSA